MEEKVIRPAVFSRGHEPQEEPHVEAGPPATYEDLALTEIAYGEELLGTLTNQEAELFVQYYEATTLMDEINRELSGTTLMSLGQDVRSGKANDRGYEPQAVDAAAAREFFRAMGLVQKLKGELFYRLGERFGAHDYVLGMRTKRRVVKVRRKW